MFIVSIFLLSCASKQLKQTSVPGCHPRAFRLWLDAQAQPREAFETFYQEPYGNREGCGWGDLRDGTAFGQEHYLAESVALYRIATRGDTRDTPLSVLASELQLVLAQALKHNARGALQVISEIEPHAALCASLVELEDGEDLETANNLRTHINELRLRLQGMGSVGKKVKSRGTCERAIDLKLQVLEKELEDIEALGTH